MTYSTRDIAGFKTRVQAEFKKNPLWSVVASDTKWFCPYCAEEGVERWPKDESGRVDAMTEHLTKSCAEWSEFRGKYKSAAVLARKKQVRELRTKVKKALVTRKEWQFSDVERAWYCPYCVKETKAQIPADRQMNEECLQGIIDHVEVCFEYKRRKGKEQDFQFIQSTVTRENQKKKLRAKVRKQLEDETPVWSQRNNEGLWICPYCHAAQATIDITSPFARRENAPRQIADHLVLTCEEHAKGGPPTMLGGDLPSEEVLTLESSDRVEAPAKKPSSTRRKDPAEARTAGGAKPGSGVKTDNRGRPASAAKRPSDPAAQRTSDPAAKRPSDSAAKRPSRKAAIRPQPQSGHQTLPRGERTRAQRDARRPPSTKTSCRRRARARAARPWRHRTPRPGGETASWPRWVTASPSRPSTPRGTPS
jgi:hypothetical protein